MPAPAASDPAHALSVPEMLRIMDVATALRQDRELVEEQLNLVELKGRLRERMLAASKVTGEEVTPEEVDAAIATYYDRLHTFREPEWSVRVALAHLWVGRGPLLRRGGLVLGTLALGWWLFFSSSGPFSASGRIARDLARAQAAIATREETILAVAKDPKALAEFQAIRAEAALYAERRDAPKLQEIDEKLAGIEARLQEEYTTSVVAGPGRKSGIDRYYTDAGGKRISGYYLLVEAKRPDGTLVSRTIHDSETDKDRTVETWGERVAKEVYDRIGKDKKEDGILNETLFAVKKRGFLDEETVMAGSDGRPLTRMGQITSW